MYFTSAQPHRHDLLTQKKTPTLEETSSCSFDIQHKRKQPEHGLVAKCQDCNILQLQTLISEFLNLKSR